MLTDTLDITSSAEIDIETLSAGEDITGACCSCCCCCTGIMPTY